MKMRNLNWFDCRNGRDKSRLIRRTIMALEEIVFEFRPLQGIINPIFKNQFDVIEIARLEPYGGSFIYLHALGGIKEVDCVHGHYFWRWLEEWQWPEIIVKYKMTEKGVRNNIDDAQINNLYLEKLFEAIFGSIK